MLAASLVEKYNKPELDSMELKKLLEPNPAQMVRDLLEDFEFVGTLHEIALVKRYPSWQTLKDNIQAAIVASGLRLSSIDYAKRKYCEPLPDHGNEENDRLDLKYIEAYKSAKDYIQKSILRVSPEGSQLPSRGIFGSSLVLERLPSSFFCAHLLYGLGNRYEGHAVCRLILEQIAWAYTAFSLNKVDDLKSIITTKSISKLKKFIPFCGKLYGFLSQKTHIDYKNHIEFLRVESNKNVILKSQSEFYEYAQVILYLSDIFVIVWEISQFPYLAEAESVQLKDGVYSIRKNRPFLKTIKQHLAEIKTQLTSGCRRTRATAHAADPHRYE